MNIGEKIKQRRIELNLSADDLAESIGKDRSTIFRYENGNIDNIPVSILYPLAKVLKTSVSYFLEQEDTDMDVYDENEEINQLGSKIKRARKAKGLTQEELGNLLGVKKSAIAKYENGRVINLKQDIIKKLCDVLELSPADLILENQVKVPTNNVHSTDIIDMQNNVLEILLRMYQDVEFFSLVEKMSKLDDKQLEAIKQVISAFVN